MNLLKQMKKAVSVIASTCMIVSMVVSTGLTTTYAATSKSWNFKNSGFKDLGTISSTKTVDGLTMVATSEKTMSVKAESVTVDGTSYTYALALGGAGNTSYRAVKVPVSGSDTIKVTLRSLSLIHI